MACFSNDEACQHFQDGAALQKQSKKLAPRALCEDGSFGAIALCVRMPDGTHEIAGHFGPRAIDRRSRAI